MKKRNEERVGRCAGITKAGKPCRAAALRGGIMCLLHSRPGLAAELGQKGGQGNRPSKLAEEMELAKLDNVKDLRDLLTRATKGLITGDISPRVATGLASLVNPLLRSIEYADLEKRLEELEKEREKRNPP